MSSHHEPPAFEPRQPQQPQQPSQQSQPQSQSREEPKQKLPIHTNHCRYCNHLLLATTREIPTLPRRKPPAQDAALILPLPRAGEEEELDDTNTPNPENDAAAAAAKQPQPHYTILLSTTIPDRKPTVVRREDGFEKRRLLRCGRCRVVVGYFLDAVHFPSGGVGETADEDEDEEGKGQRAKVVYLLPGALMETGVMEANDVEKLRAMDREWAGWMESS
ncbi:hypothetical protein BO82DRAFT_355711 [Aspergillus uvarum CBS 121591]|uniref:STEEP1 domain-containing protein n=1 Tax=Aspergillus uvarum CBS 121591 TaxID=1448315 RepID=A0A319C8A5_9EURO|nr:hypothetical protein BO82DRAFT_355711 [Aspergillus uvarum CBS 121591]PYH80139.1 hypothetical protein BO82DRAFT_355711 [Aspergillus uvarum CBS 121591]